MNDNVITWLEGLDDDDHLRLFPPVYPFDGSLYQFKNDHESQPPYCLCGFTDDADYVHPGDPVRVPMEFDRIGLEAP